MNGNFSQIVEDAQKLSEAVFQVYPAVAEKYKTIIGPVVNAEQQKILFDLSVTCVGIANKDSRVQQMRDDKKNGHPTPPQPPKPPLDKNPITLDEPSKKPRDERNRPTGQLIEELDIKSPKQAGFLRYQGAISYKEWQRVRDEVSRREIEKAGGFSNPPAKL